MLGVSRFEKAVPPVPSSPPIFLEPRELSEVRICIPFVDSKLHLDIPRPLKAACLPCFRGPQAAFRIPRSRKPLRMPCFCRLQALNIKIKITIKIKFKIKMNVYFSIIISIIININTNINIIPSTRSNDLPCARICTGRL